MEQKETALASLALGRHAGHPDGVHCPGARCEHVTVQSERLLRHFRNLPVNSVLTSGESPQKRRAAPLVRLSQGAQARMPGREEPGERLVNSVLSNKKLVWVCLEQTQRHGIPTLDTLISEYSL